MSDSISLRHHWIEYNITFAAQTNAMKLSLDERLKIFLSQNLCQQSDASVRRLERMKLRSIAIVNCLSDLQVSILRHESNPDF